MYYYAMVNYEGDFSIHDDLLEEDVLDPEKVTFLYRRNTLEALHRDAAKFNLIYDGNGMYRHKSRGDGYHYWAMIVPANGGGSSIAGMSQVSPKDVRKMSEFYVRIDNKMKGQQAGLPTGSIVRLVLAGLLVLSMVTVAYNRDSQFRQSVHTIMEKLWR